jgi:transposase InsO family protein
MDCLQERLSLYAFATRTEVYDAVARYIDGFYNPTRRHSTLGDISPMQYELEAKLAA